MNLVYLSHLSSEDIKTKEEREGRKEIFLSLSNALTHSLLCRRSITRVRLQLDDQTMSHNENKLH